MGVTSTWGTVIKGHCIRKVEKHCFKVTSVYKSAFVPGEDKLSTPGIEKIKWGLLQFIKKKSAKFEIPIQIIVIHISPVGISLFAAFCTVQSYMANYIYLFIYFSENSDIHKKDCYYCRELLVVGISLKKSN